jgi:hypothetical protein
MVTPQETVVAGSRLVVILDHIKNNRIEYLVLLTLSHIMGATAYVSERAAGVCA